MKLAQLFEKKGKQRSLQGNTPMLVNAPGSVWMVLRGRVDLFWISLKDGRPEGHRNHVCAAESGDLFFGVWKQSASHGIMAVGIEEASVAQLSREDFAGLFDAEDIRGEALDHIERYVQKLGGAIALGAIRSADTLLTAQDKFVLAQGQSAYPENQVLWVRPQLGLLRLCSLPDQDIFSAETFFPLTRSLCVQAEQDATLQAKSTDQVWNENILWPAMDLLHQTLLRWVQTAATDEETAVRKRIAEKVTADEAIKVSALTSFATILEEDQRAVPDFSHNAVLAAMNAVGKAPGITFHPLPAWIKTHRTRETVDAIARVSRVRHRAIALRGHWWKWDCGPLLGLLQENDAPVALLPSGRNGYVIFNPADHSSIPLNAKTAASLEPSGYTFYAPLPHKPIGIKELLRFELPFHKADMRTVAWMAILSSMLGVAMPIATGFIFNTVIPGADRGRMMELLFGLAAATIASTLFSITNSVAMLRIEGKWDSNMQSAVWDRLLSLPVSFFRQYTVGDLARRAMGVNLIRHELSGVAITSVIGLVTGISNFILLFHYDTTLALTAAGMLLVSMIFFCLFGWLDLRLTRTMMIVEGKISGLLFQLLSGIAKIRIAGCEARAFAVWAEKFRDQKRMAFRSGIFQNVIGCYQEMIPIIASIMIYLEINAFDRDVSTGTFVAFTAAFSMVLSAGLAFVSSMIDSMSIFPAAQRLQPILATLPEVDESKPDPGMLKGHVEINHVHFRYLADGPLVLDDVSFEVKPGEFVSLVGPSGAGKSSLLRLLLGFDHPHAGSVCYDGQDISKIDVGSVRRQIGVVLQSSRLMSGDIFTNIAGSLPITMDQAWEAARMAGLEEDIKQMPMGMQTFLSEGAGAISGGQRQRLMIARALVKKPRIVYFDEATSALDNETQALVSESLEKLRAARVVIAHRMSTVRNADKIYVMQKGKIIQRGTFDELSRQTGLFADLIARQLE